jgi:hypothetical protein
MKKVWCWRCAISIRDRTPDARIVHHASRVAPNFSYIPVSRGHVGLSRSTCTSGAAAVECTRGETEEAEWHCAVAQTLRSLGDQVFVDRVYSDVKSCAVCTDLSNLTIRKCSEV